MDRGFLEQLGLDVTEADGVVEAELELRSGQAFNPLTRRIIERVNFTVMGDRLLFVGPPEFVGAQPINLAFISPQSRIEDLVLQTLNEHLFQLERRSNELTALGISPRVDPGTLQLTAELERPPMKFVIGASRSGQFRLLKAVNDGIELTNATHNVFELSEFFERRALEEFLFAFYSDIVDDPLAQPQAQPPALGDEPATIKHTPTMMMQAQSLSPDSSLAFRELFSAFGDTFLPPRSPLEVVADVVIGEQKLRFAAARVQGKTFRGLLAGPAGKIWAERFELDDFPGIRAFVASLLNVAMDEVQVVAE